MLAPLHSQLMETPQKTNIKRIMNPYMMRQSNMISPSPSSRKSRTKLKSTNSERKEKKNSFTLFDSYLLKISNEKNKKTSEIKNFAKVQSDLDKQLLILKEKKNESIKKKRDILMLTGSISSKKLKNLMQTKLEQKDDYYSYYKINYKNYKYKKPNFLCEQIFHDGDQYLSAEMERLFYKKTAHNYSNEKPETKNFPKTQTIFSDEKYKTFNFENEKNNNKLYFRSRTSNLSQRQKNNYFLKSLERNSEEDNLVLPITKNEKLQIFKKIDCVKNTKMINEYYNLCKLSKKIYLSFKVAVETEWAEEYKDKEIFFQDQTYVFMCALKNNFQAFERKNSIVIDRILLSLDFNPLLSFSIISPEDYFKLARLAYITDNNQKNLIDFVIKFFRVENTCTVTKEEFFRMMKMLTEQIDARNEDKNLKKTLFDNFIENYYITGVITQNEDNVNFEMFQKVYEKYQMNVYDLIELIFGRI